MIMKVKNIKGTSRYRDPYGHESWIDYWCKHRYKIYVCASCGNGCCHDLVYSHFVTSANNICFCFMTCSFKFIPILLPANHSDLYRRLLHPYMEF